MRAHTERSRRALRVSRFQKLPLFLFALAAFDAPDAGGP